MNGKKYEKKIPSNLFGNFDFYNILSSNFSKKKIIQNLSNLIHRFLFHLFFYRFASMKYNEYLAKKEQFLSL